MTLTGWLNIRRRFSRFIHRLSIRPWEKSLALIGHMESARIRPVDTETRKTPKSDERQDDCQYIEWLEESSCERDQPRDVEPQGPAPDQ